MKTVKEVSRLSGVSVRTLHHYDEIGLLKPTDTTETGYRLYDDAALERLQHILLFRELQFPLKDIKKILDSPDFERNKALEQQIELLTMKKEHLENLILFARGIHGLGVRRLDFSVFDTRKMDEYAAQAKANWQHTESYQEYEAKTKGQSKAQTEEYWKAMMGLFVEFGSMRTLTPESAEVQAQVKKLQEYITAHFYTCTNDILYYLSRMYCGGGAMNENIDAAGGEGTGAFVAEAIAIYCGKKV